MGDVKLSALDEVVACYEGSDGDRTIALFNRLNTLGPAGAVAVNLFRALKASDRAKTKYKGRWVGVAYDRKRWAISNLATTLTAHAASLGLGWGWGHDPEKINFEWVLYIDLPTGQVSFHHSHRLDGPDHPTGWDGVRGVVQNRMARWVASVLDGAP